MAASLGPAPARVPRYIRAAGLLDLRMGLQWGSIVRAEARTPGSAESDWVAVGRVETGWASQ